MAGVRIEKIIRLRLPQGSLPICTGGNSPAQWSVPVSPVGEARQRIKTRAAPNALRAFLLLVVHREHFFVTIYHRFGHDVLFSLGLIREIKHDIQHNMLDD